MPYSLRTKLKHLAYERDITVKECERLIKALDTLDAVEESNFSPEQYKADLQDAYDCAYNCGYAEAMNDIAESDK